MSRTDLRRWPAVAAVVLTLCCALAAADLHFLVVADTNDPAIGTIEDLANSRSWAHSIAERTGLRLNYQALSGPSVTVARTRRLLASVQPGPDDVICFFYSGHGANPDGRYWPVFYYVLSDGREAISFDEVVHTLLPRNPRLLIVLADACNNYIFSSGRGRPYLPPGPATEQVRENFRRLFVDFRGVVLAAGASPGEYSIGGAGEGGFFINSLMNTLNQLAAQHPALDWETVLAQAAEATTAASASLVDEQGNPMPNAQHPIYSVVGGLVASATPESLGLEPTDALNTAEDPGGALPDTVTSGPPAVPYVFFRPLCGGIGPVSLSGMTLAMLTFSHVRHRRR